MVSFVLRQLNVDTPTLIQVKRFQVPTFTPPQRVGHWTTNITELDDDEREPMTVGSDDEFEDITCGERGRDNIQDEHSEPDQPEPQAPQSPPCLPATTASPSHSASPVTPVRVRPCPLTSPHPSSSTPSPSHSAFLVTPVRAHPVLQLLYCSTTATEGVSSTAG